MNCKQILLLAFCNILIGLLFMATPSFLPQRQHIAAQSNERDNRTLDSPEIRCMPQGSLARPNLVNVVRHGRNLSPSQEVAGQLSRLQLPADGPSHQDDEEDIHMDSPPLSPIARSSTAGPSSGSTTVLSRA
ncbi:hypothetical protein C8F01DRAFT_380061 [Mycena amicta]|nr:hypothetical protein C8F01DRAFT_380061 [Mycena amicta]